MTLDKLIIATRLCLLAVFLLVTGNAIALFGSLPYLWLIFPVLGAATPCANCSSGTQNTTSMQVDVASVTNGVCTDCANWNTTFICNYAGGGGCSYGNPSITVCTIANNGFVTAFWMPDGSVKVVLTTQGGAQVDEASSSATSTPRDCSSPSGLSGLSLVNTFTDLPFGTVRCTVTGATATVTP